jgi:TolA-binding protein
MLEPGATGVARGKRPQVARLLVTIMWNITDLNLPVRRAMNRPVLSGVVIVLVLGSFASSASAQGRGMRQRGLMRRPTVSPYLNLLRNDQDVASNYYNLVRPQLDQITFNNHETQTIQSLQRQVNQESQRGPYSTTELRATGHGATYMNYSHYYGNRPGSTGGGGLGGNQGGNRGGARARTPQRPAAAGAMGMGMGGGF